MYYLLFIMDITNNHTEKAPTFNYTEEELFDRCYQLINDKKGTPDQKKQHLTPIFDKQGRKTQITNFKEICEALNRKMDDFQKFLQDELSTQSSITESGAILLNKPYKPKQVRPTLDKYVKSRVCCSQCKSLNTLLKKEGKITFLECTMCRSKNALE